jgi:LysM repeat protein
MVISINVSAQTDSLEVHTINGKEYYIHIIEKGESLYSLHKKYNIPLEVINKENPSVLDGLSIGEKIFIPLQKDIEVEVKTNGNFINHEVTKQQTLYSIANLYKVQQNEILAANPEISEGLKEGQVIRIPVKNIKQNTTEVKTLIQSPQYKTHVVKKGETLYSLTKLYNTTVDSMKLVNVGLTQGLREGETIYVPILLNPNTSLSGRGLALEMSSKLDSLSKDTFKVVKKSEYAIALFLPLYLDENDEMVENRKALEDRAIYPRSKFAIEFYNGFIMALDSISTAQQKFKVYVYDTGGKDTLRMHKLLQKEELKKVDLIVGPLYYENFKEAVEFAQANNIPIVSPVRQSNKTLLGNDFVFKAIPSQTSIIEPFTKLLVDSFSTANLLAVEHEKSKEKILVELYVKSYNAKMLSKNDTGISSTIKTLKITSNYDNIIANLKSDKNNVIFIPTSSQTFVSSLFNYFTNKLNERGYKDYRVTVLGLEDWMKYENIDLDYFQTLNVHYCDPQFVNEEDSLTANFIKRYVNVNNTYPSNNSFLGFELAYYFGGHLIDKGKINTSIQLPEYKGMSIDFKFFKTGVESGYENMSNYLLRFDDYVLKKLN